MEKSILQRIKLLNYTSSCVAKIQQNPSPVNYPVRLAAAVTQKCNYNCIMCNQPHSNSDISPEHLSVLDDALPFATDLVITGGEPLMYSGFFELAEKCSQNKVLASTNTNGSLMGVNDNLQNLVRYMGEIRISIDAGKPDTYKYIRKHDNFDKIIENIAKMTKLKQQLNQKTPEIVFTFVGMRSNIAELSRLVHIAKHVGVSRVHANHLYLDGNQHHLLDESPFGCQRYFNSEVLKAFAVAQKCGVTLRLPSLFAVDEPALASGSTGHSSCAWPWEYFELYPSGTSAICCSGAGTCGDAGTESFDQMWNHPRRQEIRSTVNTQNELPCCRDCGSSVQKDSTNLRSFVVGGDEAEIMRYFASLPEAAFC